MQESSFIHYIRICQAKRLIIPLLFTAVILFLLTLLPIFGYSNAVSVSAVDHLSTAVNRQISYAEVDASDLYYAGDDYYVNGVLTGHYYYTFKDGYCRFYILQAETGKPAETYISERHITGKIVKIGENSDVLFQDMAKEMNWSAENLKNVCDSYLINEAIYFPAAQKILLVLIIMALAVGLVSILYTLLLLAFPICSRALRRLAKYGNAREILADAEKELRDNCIFRESNMALTPKYLFEFSQDHSAIIPLESALWVYQLQNIAYSYKLHRERMVYTMRIYTITGDTFILKDKAHTELEKISDMLTENYPNFFYGYSEEHDHMVHYILDESRKELKQNKKKHR